MEIIQKKAKKKFLPIVPERNSTSIEKFKKQKNLPCVFNKRRNPISFVVDWQLANNQE